MVVSRLTFFRGMLVRGFPPPYRGTGHAFDRGNDELRGRIDGNAEWRGSTVLSKAAKAHFRTNHELEADSTGAAHFTTNEENGRRG